MTACAPFADRWDQEAIDVIFAEIEAGVLGQGPLGADRGRIVFRGIELPFAGHGRRVTRILERAGHGLLFFTLFDRCQCVGYM